VGVGDRIDPELLIADQSLTLRQGALALARGARGQDKEGYRAEFIKLAETARLLAQNQD